MTWDMIYANINRIQYTKVGIYFTIQLIDQIKLPKCFCHGFPWDWDAPVIFEGGHIVTKCQNLFGTEVFLPNGKFYFNSHLQTSKMWQWWKKNYCNYKYHDQSNQKMNISQKMNKFSQFTLIELWGKWKETKMMAKCSNPP